MLQILSKCKAIKTAVTIWRTGNWKNEFTLFTQDHFELICIKVSNYNMSHLVRRLIQ